MTDIQSVRWSRHFATQDYSLKICYNILMSIPSIEKTHEEKLKDHVNGVIYEIGVVADYIKHNVEALQASVLMHPEFTPQEIFTLFGESTPKIIALTRGLKSVLATYDPEKYPNVEVDLSGIIN